jgi:peptidylprolyl isomerase
MKFHYTGKFESGEVFDSSEGKDPLEFEPGKNMIIPGLEKALVKLKKGDKKTIKVEAKDAYGEHKKELLKEIPKGPVPEGMKLEKGTVLYLKTPDGQPFPVKIEDVKEKTVVVDLNHPLAGKKLVFEVEVV